MLLALACCVPHWSMQGTGQEKPIRAIGSSLLAPCHETLAPKYLLKALLSPLSSVMAGETNSTLPVSSHKPDLHGHPSDPTLHISCFADSTLPDRCPPPCPGLQCKMQPEHSCLFKPTHPQGHGLSDGSVPVQVSAPSLSPSSACLWLCWGYMATRHSPWAWGMLNAQGDPTQGRL